MLKLPNDVLFIIDEYCNNKLIKTSQKLRNIVKSRYAQIDISKIDDYKHEDFENVKYLTLYTSLDSAENKCYAKTKELVLSLTKLESLEIKTSNDKNRFVIFVYEHYPSLKSFSISSNANKTLYSDFKTHNLGLRYEYFLYFIVNSQTITDLKLCFDSKDSTTDFSIISKFNNMKNLRSLELKTSIYMSAVVTENNYELFHNNKKLKHLKLIIEARYDDKFAFNFELINLLKFGTNPNLKTVILIFGVFPTFNDYKFRLPRLDFSFANLNYAEFSFICNNCCQNDIKIIYPIKIDINYAKALCELFCNVKRGVLNLVNFEISEEAQIYFKKNNSMEINLTSSN